MEILVNTTKLYIGIKNFIYEYNIIENNLDIKHSNFKIYN